MKKFRISFGPLRPLISQNLYKLHTNPAKLIRPGQVTNTESQADGDNSKDQPKNINTRSKRGKKCGQTTPVVTQDPAPPGGKYITDLCGFYDAPKTNSRKWKKISLLSLSVVVAFSAFIMTVDKEHPKREFIPYSYLYIHNKRFAWGDGKRSLFHGPNNFIRDEQETRSADEQ